MDKQVFLRSLLALFENWPGEFEEILKALIKWYDDPTGFFFTYITGYIVIWWKPLLGSVIIMLGSILVFIINIDNPGFLIFAAPTFLVGFFYMESWYLIRKKKKAVVNDYHLLMTHFKIPFLNLAMLININ